MLLGENPRKSYQQSNQEDPGFLLQAIWDLTWRIFICLKSFEHAGDDLIKCEKESTSGKDFPADVR